ncbi:AAA ATPase, central region [Nitrobacter hamburgensis X14]|uniref:AAA ATPase, central region n=1 Tax=Nitrobacter hamburgensis (strain DSM 10229 / NCIMB 13809 / X14) TaxID=323097 RepID=Q1QPZ4_NITHX|nr:AAA ATPase, central region [Nitrobacter hamburgensis X14]
MSEAAGFAANNSAYLQAGLHWLRALLADRARPSLSLVPMEKSAPPRRRRFFGVDLRPDDSAAAPELLARPTQDSATAAAAKFEEAAGLEPRPALVVLAERFGLTTFERNILLLCAAMEIDPHLPALIAEAQHVPAGAAPTFGLALELFEDPSWDALAPARPLRRHQLVEVYQSGVASLIAAPLRIDERIAAYIKGLNYLDERLLAIAEPVPPPASLPASQEALARRIELWVAHGAPATCIELIGRNRVSKREVAAAALAAVGINLLAIPFSQLPREAEGIERFASLWARETQLMPIALLVAPPEPMGMETGDGVRPTPQWNWLLRLPGIVMLDMPSPGAESSAHLIEIAPPTIAERRALWAAAWPEDGPPDGASLERLAGEFALPASRIRLAVKATAVESGGPPEIGQLWTWCVTHAGGALEGLAERLVPRATIDEVKVPERDREQLDRLIRHARSRGIALDTYGFSAIASRGLGLAALFHGESGTGKTMAAEAVAHELGLALFRVDLASVMSKYIGDTTKKLRSIFDAAEGGGIMLLFDEADAVFGKRSEVKDSHDRFANIDINYLLTRMEAFGGITILATNMKHALDPAFLRRLRFVISFSFPGVAEREAIWRGVFPPDAPMEALDYPALARFPLTGGSIFNAALGAAHEAAAEGKPIAMRHILIVVRAELQKMERPVPEREFAPLREISGGASP